MKKPVKRSDIRPCKLCTTSWPQLWVAITEWRGTFQGAVPCIVPLSLSRYKPPIRHSDLLIAIHAELIEPDHTKEQVQLPIHNSVVTPCTRVAQGGGGGVNKAIVWLCLSVSQNL